MDNPFLFSRKAEIVETPEGTLVIHLRSGDVVTRFSDGTEVIVYRDGTEVAYDPNRYFATDKFNR